MLREHDFVRNWDCDDAKPAFRRLDLLLSAQCSVGEIAQDTPGGRNRRYLALHRDLVGRTMEAQARCPKCATLCEFPLPREEMLASDGAEAAREIELTHAGETYRFRLPRMTDIEALAPDIGSDEIGCVVAQACRIGEGDVLPKSVVSRLNDALDEADPLASPTFEVKCEECSQAFSASVDLAGFVAREFDLLLDRVLRDVDRLARAYGWSEAEVLAIPPSRRTRYLAMPGASARSTRPVAV